MILIGEGNACLGALTMEVDGTIDPQTVEDALGAAAISEMEASLEYALIAASLSRRPGHRGLCS